MPHLRSMMSWAEEIPVSLWHTAEGCYSPRLGSHLGLPPLFLAAAAGDIQCSVPFAVCVELPQPPRQTNPSLGAGLVGKSRFFLLCPARAALKYHHLGLGMSLAAGTSTLVSRGLEEKAAREARDRADPESSDQHSRSQDTNFGVG